MTDPDANRRRKEKENVEERENEGAKREMEQQERRRTAEEEEEDDYGDEDYEEDEDENEEDGPRAGPEPEQEPEPDLYEADFSSPISGISEVSGGPSVSMEEVGGGSGGAENGPMQTAAAAGGVSLSAAASPDPHSLDQGQRRSLGDRNAGAGDVAAPLSAASTVLAGTFLQPELGPDAEPEGAQSKGPHHPPEHPHPHRHVQHHPAPAAKAATAATAATGKEEPSLRGKGQEEVSRGEQEREGGSSSGTTEHVDGQSAKVFDLDAFLAGISDDEEEAGGADKRHDGQTTPAPAPAPAPLEAAAKRGGEERVVVQGEGDRDGGGSHYSNDFDMVDEED